MKISGAIFDLDGTLLDSMQIWDNIGGEYLKSINIEPCDDLREVLRPMSLLQAAEYFRSDYGVDASSQEIMDTINDMIEHFYYDIVLPKDGVLGFLEALKQKDIKMCVATATDRHLVEAALKRNGLLSYFEKIFTCTELCVGKDRPDIFLRALNALGTKLEETYIFEDALFAIRTAKSAGFPIIAIYDATAKEQQNEIRELADIYIKSFHEMRDCI